MRVKPKSEIEKPVGYFEKNIQQLCSNDGKIDSLVYSLYGLTKEEIRIVEAKN